SAGLALPGGGAAAHTQTRLLAARGGGDRIELHDLAALHGTTLRLNSAVAQTSSTRSRCPDARIIPRISGVSATIRESRMRRRPSPRTVARWLLSCPLTLRTSVTLRFLPCALLMAVAPRFNRGFPQRSCRASRRSHPATGCW